MDTNQQIEDVKNQLRAEGFDEEKLNKLMDLAVEEIMDIAMTELENTASDETLEQLASEQDAPVSTVEEGVDRLERIFVAAYGENADQKKLEMMLAYLQDTLEQTRKAKDLLQKYQAGDPSAVAQVKAQEGNPDVDEVMKYMDKPTSEDASL